MESNVELGQVRQVGLSAGEGAHGGKPIFHLGAALEDAVAVVIMVHGRGASAGDILSLAPYLAVADVAYLAPQAANSTWYPYSFLAPRAQNEPYLSAALDAVGALVALAGEQGIQAERVVLAGFSQGACLASEYAARNPRRYGGVIAFSGGLIGPEDESLDHAGDLAGTPIFLGCSDVDPHIPLTRVEETAEVLARMNAQVTKRIYPGMDHTVNEDEVEFARRMIQDACKE